MQGKRTSLYTWFLSLMALAAVALLAGRPAMAADYKINSGDTVKVNVVGEPSYDGTYTVTGDGKINLPYFGTVLVLNKTVEQVQKELTAKYALYLKRPIVGVDVTSYVTVTGDVGRPGKIAVKPGERLSYYLDQAGSINNDTAEKSKATILSRGEAQARPIDVAAVISGDQTKNIEVKAGDAIFIPKKLGGTVKVLGAVSKPGDVAFKSDATLAEIVSLAGGQTAKADLSKALLVRRGQTDSIPVDLEALATSADPSKNMRLQDGDTIYIPTKDASLVTSGTDSVKIRFLGEVREPGTQKELKADTTALDAIRQAPLTDKSDKTEIVIRHKDGSKVQVNLDSEDRGEGNPALRDLRLQDGDEILVANLDDTQIEVSGPGVKEPKKIPYEPEMRVATAITKAGYFQPRAMTREISVIHRDGKSQTVNLDKYLKNNDLSQNIPLQKGDIVVVDQSPEKGPSNNNNSQWINALIGTLSSALIWKSIYR